MKNNNSVVPYNLEWIFNKVRCYLLTLPIIPLHLQLYLPNYAPRIYTGLLKQKHVNSIWVEGLVTEHTYASTYCRVLAYV